MGETANAQAVSGRPEFYAGIDIGGTFTDGILIDGQGNVYHFKTPSVPANPSEGFMQCLIKAAKFLGMPLEDLLRSIRKLSYGNTIATNALLENKAAKTGLITTRGFKDVLAIARLGREYLGIDLQCERPEPLVPHRQIEEITERIDSRGEVVTLLVEQELNEILEKFDASKIGAICWPRECIDLPSSHYAISPFRLSDAPRGAIIDRLQPPGEIRYDRERAAAVSRRSSRQSVASG